MLPRSAEAFCRTTSAPERCNEWRRKGGKGCCPYGQPLYWRSACVGYSLQKDGSRYVNLARASETVALSFAKWTSLRCPTRGDRSSSARRDAGSGSDRVSIDVRDLGPVACDEVNYEPEGPNQNVIVFRDDGWDHSDSENTLGLTTVQFDPGTGEIRDADIEINTAHHRLAFEDPVPPNRFDFESIITHEAGHFLGLAHSSDPEAAMFATHERGSTRIRQLAEDDVEALCKVYPPDGTRTVADGGSVAGGRCDPTPLRGLARDCVEGEPSASCEAAPLPAGEGGGGAGVAATGAIAVLAAVRWRRARARLGREGAS